MGNAFTWMRPNDLVWNYWVNNYLMGEDPPVFDILSWNADGTNLPAALHRSSSTSSSTTRCPSPGALEALGTPIDLGTIKVPDLRHRRDQRPPDAVEVGCYRTTQLLSGDSTFALSNAGHIASLVNPPGNPKASYFTGPLSTRIGRRQSGSSAPRSTPAPGGSTGPTGSRALRRARAGT